MTAASGLVIVDKPGGMTSHDVVARIRRLAHTRRVGHAGTLDPMATGVLVVGIEKATRLLGHLTLTEKTYEATIRLGQSTTTDDAEGEAAGGSPAAGVVSGAALNAEIARLTGDILQVPSSVSAIKVNGQRAYKLTRAGEAPDLAARPVTIHEFTILGLRRDGDFLDIDARIRCSSGTYIRAIARDLGAALDTGGHLTALRRTAVGPYTLNHAYTLEELEDQDQNGPERPRLTPARHPGSQFPPAPAAPRSAAGLWVTPLAEAAAAAFPRLDLTADEARRLAQGARLPLPPHPPAGPADPGDTGTNDWPSPGDPVAAFDPDGTLVALVTADSGRLRSLAVFTA
ncbi:MAG TPA: tRNA pseudouridine(55) synthase TruB [Trebonia sp.]|nr:tRNA pseudouridine(55) synthase TruB [Trebonia sp.]